MNFYSMGMPLVGSVSGSSRRRNDPYYRVPTPAKPKCQAKILRAKKSLLDGSASEEYEPCRAPAVKDDILCSVHRRLVNISAMEMGEYRQGGSPVRVPFEAYAKAKFTLGDLKDQGDKGSASLPTKKAEVDIWSSGDVEGVLRHMLQ